MTEKGKKALGIEENASKRYGGMEHQYWQERLADRLTELGWQVEKKHPIGGGKTVDLVATKNGRRIAFEVETGNSDIAANVTKIPPGRSGKLIVVLTSRRAGARARGLEGRHLEFTKATHVEHFLAKEEGMLAGQKSEGQVL